MRKVYMHVVDNVVRDKHVFDYEPEPAFLIERQFVEEPAERPVIGSTLVNGVWTAPPPPARPADEQRRIDILQRTEVADQMQRLNSATPEQIEAWVNANMTTLAQARVVIATILKILAARL